MPLHKRVRQPPRGAEPYLLDTCRICSLLPARQHLQRLTATRHAGLEAAQRQHASPAAPQRDDRGGNAGARPRFEPAHVDIPQTREEALVLLEQLQQVLLILTPAEQLQLLAALATNHHDASLCHVRAHTGMLVASRCKASRPALQSLAEQLLRNSKKPFAREWISALAFLTPADACSLTGPYNSERGTVQSLQAKIHSDLLICVNV